MTNKETLKQAGYTFVKRNGKDYILKDEDGKLEVFFNNPNHASWGIKDTINGKEVDLEFARSFKESLDESEGNGYIAFYGGKKIEVHADTSYKAQLKATEEFQKMNPRKKIKSYEVTVKLAEKDGKQVTTHSESKEPVTGKGKWTAKVGKNKNTFDVFLNGKYQFNMGADSAEKAITLGKKHFKEIYKNPTIMDSNIGRALTILEGGIPNTSGIRDALDKAITGDADLSDRERLVLLKYKLIGDNGKPTRLAREQFSELFEGKLSESDAEQWDADDIYDAFMNDKSAVREIENKIVPKIKKERLSDFSSAFKMAVDKFLRGKNIRTTQDQVNKVTTDIYNHYKKEIKNGNFNNVYSKNWPNP